MITMNVRKGESMYTIPESMPQFKDRFSLENYTTREKYIKEGMFAFVSWKWVNPFVSWIGNKKCLEVMAGRGILSLALRQKGTNVIATDDFSWADKKERDTFRMWSQPVTDVEEIDAIEAVKKYGDSIDVLIMSWPYMDDTAFKVIKELHKTNPKAQIVYIGESDGGCTADDLFFKHFEEIEDDEEFNIVVKQFERWNGLHDCPYLGKYK